ncbi:hypothetical protein HH110_15405 [Stenotrophomonas sp. SAM-B]|uniref:M56 family metallopeptidase n=1 Tax=Stenotrophomonas sp. SAM-B TaxID=2729141 RepID=UPI0015A17BD4|nr:M56 family metallopeptidase [Stenotrophomonas sp. SAM-B]NWF34425.1 hypothetical protein [Stenotrophomonas sp. SAM-B]
MAVQHLWHSALLFALAALVLGRSRLSAEARSWALCAAFVLAAASPLLVLLPRSAPTPIAVAQQTVSPPTANSAVQVIAPKPAYVAHAMTTSTTTPTLLHGVVVMWLLGTLWGLGRLGQGAWHARRLHRSARRAPALESLLRGELPSGARIALSDRAPGPMVVGLWSPRILVPTTMASTLPPAALRDLLLHEAAHIRRHDLWICAAQRALLAVYWWSPFLRLLGRRLDLAREMACDERAALRSGSGSGRGYADSLLTGIAGLIQQRDRSVPLAVAMSATRTGLRQRIDGLLTLDTRPARWTTRLGWGALCAIALVAHVGVTVAATPRLGKAVILVEDAPAASPRGASPQAEQLLSAAGTGDVSRVQQLVKTGVAVDTQVSGDGTALIIAAKQGELAMVDALLVLGAQPDLASRGDGNPLIAAARRGHLPVVERLVGAGADVNRIVAYDETPLINAARSGDVDTVAYLVEHGADVNLGVVADQGQWRSPLNQARNDRVRDYLTQRGAIAGRR